MALLYSIGICLVAKTNGSSPGGRITGSIRVLIVSESDVATVVDGASRPLDLDVLASLLARSGWITLVSSSDLPRCRLGEAPEDLNSGDPVIGSALRAN